MFILANESGWNILFEGEKKKSETGLTASVLKRDPYTETVNKKIYIKKKKTF